MANCRPIGAEQISDFLERKVELSPSHDVINHVGPNFMEKLTAPLGKKILTFSGSAPYGVVDLGHFAMTSKANQQLVLDYLDSNGEKLHTLLSYTQLIDQEDAFIFRKEAVSTRIQTETRDRRIQLQELEDKRPIKKSTFARVLSLIPTPALILPAIPKFLAANAARAAGETALNTLLLPTCMIKGNLNIPSILDACGKGGAVFDNSCNDEDANICSHAASYLGGLCDFDICSTIANNLFNNAALNDWAGGWMVGGGIASLLLASCLYRTFKVLDHVSIEEILSQRFVDFFDKDFQTLIKELLRIDSDNFNQLSIAQVIHDLNEVGKTLIQNKNRLLSSTPMQQLQRTLFFKSERKHNPSSAVFKEYTGEHVVDVNGAANCAELQDSATAPLFRSAGPGSGV